MLVIAPAVKKITIVAMTAYPTILARKVGFVASNLGAGSRTMLSSGSHAASIHSEASGLSSPPVETSSSSIAKRIRPASFPRMDKDSSSARSNNAGGSASAAKARRVSCSRRNTAIRSRVMKTSCHDQRILAASFAKYVTIKSAPARRIPSRLSSMARSGSSQPRWKAACSMEYSPETW